MFPFVWDDENNIKFEDFQKENILSSDYWSLLDRSKGLGAGDYGGNEYPTMYALYQYLTVPAREVILPDGNSEKSLYFQFGIKEKDNGKEKSKSKELHGLGLYIIHYNKEKFILQLNAINLRIFKNGIGIFTFETEWHGCKGDMSGRRPFELDDINKINEYGRRVNFPFIPKINENGDEFVFSLTASEIEIQIPQTSENPLLISDEYLEKIKKLDPNKKETLLNLTHILNPIIDLLSLHSKDDKRRCSSKKKYTFTSDSNNKSKNKIYIYPALDDRMFVCCLVMDTTLSKRIENGVRIRNGKHSVSGKALVGWTSGNEKMLANEIYKFAFIENSMSVQNMQMKKEILEKSVYWRWSDFGSLYTITHHSSVAITTNPYGECRTIEEKKDDNSIKATVITPFLTQYTQLAVLALVQRASILRLSARAAEVAEGIAIANIKSIEELQKDYVRIQSQFFINEASVEEQGREIFDMLLEQLYIERDKSYLDSQIINLRDTVNIINQKIFNEHQEESNHLIEMLTVITVITGFVAILTTLYLEEIKPFSLFVVIGMVILLLFYYHHFRKTRK